MIKLKKILLALLFVSLVCIMGFGTTQIKAHADNSSNVFEQIDAYLSDATAKAHFPSMSITIVDKENVLLSKTYGNCNSTDTPYLLGSVSKSFTALCVMQLVEQGKIDLEANMGEYMMGL